MRTPAKRRGFTLLEATVASSLVAGVLLAGTSLLRSSADVARSTNDVGIAASRVHRALRPVADRIRRASLATIQAPDGSAFADGATCAGVRLRMVEGFAGAPQLSAPLMIRWDVPVGATEGDVLLDDGLVTVVLASGVTDFAVTRNGSSFTIRAATRSGPGDDRGRGATGDIIVRTRNP